MYRWFYILLLGAIGLRGIHSFTVGSQVEIDQSPNLKTTADQATDDVSLPKVRQVDDSVISRDLDILRGVIDDQTAHLFFGEADSFIGSSNFDIGRELPADAFVTLLSPIKQQTTTENPAVPPVLIFTNDGPLQEVQKGTADVQAFDVSSRPGAQKSIGDSQDTDNVDAFFQESQSQLVLSSSISVLDEVTTKKTVVDVNVVGKIDQPLPEIRVDEPFLASPVQVPPVQVFQVQQETNAVIDSGINGEGKGRESTTSDHITQEQETEISMRTAAQSMMAQSPVRPREPDEFLIEHQGDFAVEMNPIAEDGVNTRSQTATSFNLPAGARHFPILKVKQVFTIRVQPSADISPLPVAQWREDDSSVEIVLVDRAPVQQEAEQVPQPSRMPMTIGTARREDASVEKMDSFVSEGMAGLAFSEEEANVDVDSIFVRDAAPIIMVVDDQVSPTEQHGAAVVSAAEERTQNERDVIISIPTETIFGADSIFFRSQGKEGTPTKAAKIRPQTQFQQETRTRGAVRTAVTTAGMISQIEEGTEMAGATDFQVAGANQPANKQNQIFDERAMRSAFASTASGAEELSDSHPRKTINVDRHAIDEEADEASVSVEMIGLVPIQREVANRTAIQRNRTVLIGLDDGFVSTEAVGHVDGNQAIHLPRPNQNQEAPLTKAPRRGGNRKGDKLRTVTTEPIPAAANEKHSDEVQDATLAERIATQKSGIQPFSRDSAEQDDQSLEVNFRLLSKMKRIMKPELRKQERRPSMVFFRHSEEDNDASLELNHILASPIFQRKMQEVDGRLKSAPEARGKRLMEKYAEALAISSTSSSRTVINSLLPFFIAWVLICW